MTETELLISRAVDKKRSAQQELMLTSTCFYSLEERSILSGVLSKEFKQVKTLWFGGYEDCERSVALFLPEYYSAFECALELFDAYPDECPVSVIRLEKDRFSQLSHRDYLGALMGLGIKRELIGDILCDADGAYMLCLSSIADYICNNLEKAGRASIKCRICKGFSLPCGSNNAEDCFCSVASLRLDCVLSAGFNLKRSACCEEINKGTVYVNSVRQLKNDTQVKPGDKIVLRGKGKILFDEIVGESKKGRIHISIKKYK